MIADGRNHHHTDHCQHDKDHQCKRQFSGADLSDLLFITDQIDRLLFFSALSVICVAHKLLPAELIYRCGLILLFRSEYRLFEILMVDRIREILGL